MNIVKNAVVNLQGVEGFVDGKYRVLELLPALECIILFSLGNIALLRRPEAITFELFQISVKSKKISLASYSLPFYMLLDEAQISEAHRSRRDKNYSLIEVLISSSDFLFEYSTKKRISKLATHAAIKNTDRKTLSRLLNSYWYFGQDKNGLLPAFKRSGGKGAQRTAQHRSLGAPKSPRTLAAERSDKYILKDLDKEYFRKALKKHHLKPQGKSLTQTYAEILTTYYVDEVRIANACGRAPIVPSYRQLWYWKSKLFSEDVINKSRTTERDYLLNKRGLLGSATDESLVPGSCFEIDATVADVHIVSSIGKQYALGRPTIYSIVDRASRMIVGFHVSLYHASWRAARQALANCFLPKSDYCSQYGIHIVDAEWPCAHIPQRLMCDNGEMIGLQPKELVVPMTELQLAPPYRPDFKSIVEQRFNLLNKEVLHGLLGTTRGGVVVRGMRDPRKDSIYTLREVTKLLIEAVLEHNRSIFDDLARSSRLLIEHDLLPTPINFWNIHFAKHKHATKRAEVDEIIARLLLPAEVSMTRSGIEYRGMYYSCDEILERNLASVARTNGRWRLDARIDENTTNHIYVRLNHNEGFTKCTLLPKSKILKDSTMHDAEFVQDWLDGKKEYRPVTVESIDTRKERTEMEKTAKSRVKKDTLSFAEKTKNTREHRKAELDSALNNKSEKHSQIHRNELNNRDNVVSFLPRRARKTRG